MDENKNNTMCILMKTFLMNTNHIYISYKKYTVISREEHTDPGGEEGI
jgi:uncharacterized protein YsxB (DUF464 family)